MAKQMNRPHLFGKRNATIAAAVVKTTSVDGQKISRLRAKDSFIIIECHEFSR